MENKIKPNIENLVSEAATKRFNEYYNLQVGERVNTIFYRLDLINFFHHAATFGASFAATLYREEGEEIGFMKAVEYLKNVMGVHDNKMIAGTCKSAANHLLADKDKILGIKK